MILSTVVCVIITLRARDQVLLLTHLLELVYVFTHTDVPMSMSSLLY